MHAEGLQPGDGAADTPVTPAITTGPSRPPFTLITGARVEKPPGASGPPTPVVFSPDGADERSRPSPRRTAPSRRLTGEPLTTHGPKAPGEPDHRPGSAPCPSSEIAPAARQLSLNDISSPPVETARLEWAPSR
ncbi:hypothetical protein GCM10010345_74530 [Streptomyces canarius]|uniref:Uncharacterized protein n=1 Tax=Streptomyces canarius TaxID=285453 RepID=A0ABQ3DAI1_9ACTN|nr:hypothetical protein GCM10010345_74530 [Streptomyces canarius]